MKGGKGSGKEKGKIGWEGKKGIWSKTGWEGKKGNL